MTERVINFAGYVPPHEKALQEFQDEATQQDKLPYGEPLKHLLYGYGTGAGNHFKTLDEYRDAWERHRSELMQTEWKAIGSRPAAFWICDFEGEVPSNGLPESPLHFGRTIPAREDQAEILQSHGLLTDDELAALGLQAA